ncbi:undecaprenyl-diphosphatase [Bacillus aquiflavi]|uniref:undecaprenyl-diphosphatase n=1 Tax=Bacillus aquiflavi TaxID=2672567 RepID=UPI001CA9FF6F|nr:undecaprenyl-diphosphatase [Bacillus aquiflavi]UAC48853.1 undecaprenyl-diphosphatase [Bacillus aquiflavi]
MDEKMFRAINRFSGHLPLLDMLMIFISKKVRYVFILVLIFKYYQSSAHKNEAVHATRSALFALLILFFIKLFYFKPRPFVKRRVGILIPSKMDSSFPSKHTMLTFAVSTAIFLHERVLGAILGGLATLTGFSRVWLGHHYPSDVLGSALIGSLTSMLTGCTFSKNKNLKQ